MIASCGVLVPVLRIVPGFAIRRRASAAIVILFITGVYVLSRAGFAAGVTVMLVSIALMGVVYVGRRLGFVLIGLSALAHLAVGLLVSNGIIQLDGKEVDPMMMQNWIRMAAITSLLAVLLANMIDSVIRHVEANSQSRHRGAGQAARRLRTPGTAARQAGGRQGRRASLPGARAAR